MDQHLKSEKHGKKSRDKNENNIIVITIITIRNSTVININ